MKASVQLLPLLFPVAACLTYSRDGPSVITALNCLLPTSVPSVTDITKVYVPGTVGRPVINPSAVNTKPVGNVPDCNVQV
ncbi:hypothetical protein D3C86_785530 [compost metagenome]